LFAGASADRHRENVSPAPRSFSIDPQARRTRSCCLDVVGPWFSIASEPGGKPRLRVHLERNRLTEIEASSDLKKWRLHTEETPSTGYIDIPSETATNRVEFFRAVVIE
jgi:hypothetical protein